MITGISTVYKNLYSLTYVCPPCPLSTEIGVAATPLGFNSLVLPVAIVLGSSGPDAEVEH